MAWTTTIATEDGLRSTTFITQFDPTAAVHVALAKRDNEDLIRKLREYLESRNKGEKSDMNPWPGYYHLRPADEC